MPELAPLETIRGRMLANLAAAGWDVDRIARLMASGGAPLTAEERAALEGASP